MPLKKARIDMIQRKPNTAEKESQPIAF